MSQKPKNLFFPLIFTITFMLVICLTACGLFQENAAKKYTKTDFLLDTVVSVTVYDKEHADIIDKCLEAVRDYEKLFSRTDPESELYALNQLGRMEVSSELLEVIKTALHYCEVSGGRFDITMGEVSAMYGFSSPAPAKPSDKRILSAMSHTGWEKISIEDSTVILGDPEAVIDLGAIAKGYIADRLADMLRSAGVESAIIDLGGNIVCVGGKPDGSDFKVGIQYPYGDSSTVIATASLQDMSVVTSGVYQRYFEENGKLYHHILDPDSGYPVENGLLSVSIISKRSIDCDGLSTSVFAMGLDDGLELIDSMDGVWAVFVDEDFNVYYSEGFEEMFLS